MIWTSFLSTSRGFDGLISVLLDSDAVCVEGWSILVFWRFGLISTVVRGNILYLRWNCLVTWKSLCWILCELQVMTEICVEVGLWRIDVYGWWHQVVWCLWLPIGLWFVCEGCEQKLAKLCVIKHGEFSDELVVFWPPIVRFLWIYRCPLLDCVGLVFIVRFWF